MSASLKGKLDEVILMLLRLITLRLDNLSRVRLVL